MTVVIGNHCFEHVVYDEEGDVLYLRAGETRDPASTYATPEGHAVRFDEQGSVIGMTLVNARWLLERDGRIVITVPERIETSADDLAGVLDRALKD
jgi:uncharacterized protein YuzE